MKLKALLLVACATAGVGASVALADNGNHDGQGDQPRACRAMRIAGTVAPQTFTLTITHAQPHGSLAAGSTVTVTIGGTGQIVTANVGGCSGANGTTTTTTSALTVRSVDLQARPTPPPPETTTGKGHHDDEHHRTTTTTTTATTTTTSS